LDDDRYLINTKMYLAVSAEMGEANLINRAPQLIKVCSANHLGADLPQVVQKRLCNWNLSAQRPVDWPPEYH